MVAVHASVQFEHGFAARFLMQSVDILGDDARKFPLAFERRNLVVRRVGPRVQKQHLFPIKIEKFFCMPQKKGMRQDRFGRILELLSVQSVL